MNQAILDQIKASDKSLTLVAGPLYPSLTSATYAVFLLDMDERVERLLLNTDAGDDIDEVVVFFRSAVFAARHPEKTASEWASVIKPPHEPLSVSIYTGSRADGEEIRDKFAASFRNVIRLDRYEQ